MSLGGRIRRNLYWANDFFHGSPVGSQYTDMDNILMDKERGQEKTGIYLKKLLAHAAENTDFYKGYRGSDLSDHPVMNKLLLTENKAACTSKCHWKNNYFQRTSGSTGAPFVVVQDMRKRNRVIAELKLFGKRCGYESHEKMTQIRMWRKNKKTWLESFMQNILCVDIASMTDAEMYSIKKLLIEKRVSAVLAYATTLKVFAKWLQNNISDKDLFCLKTIISGSEALEDETKASLERILGCNVVERYSNQENGVLGQQVPGDKKYYLNYGSYVFEVLKLASDETAAFGEPGRIVITDLFNYAFPMIRYDTGDVGVMRSGNEESGGWPILSELYGRRIDIIYDTSERPVYPHLIARNMGQCNNIRQSQFIQTGMKEYVFRVNGCPDDDKLTLSLNKQKDILGYDALIKVEYTDEIPVLASGKRKTVAQEAPEYRGSI